MPFPNEHACRIRDPGEFQADSFRRLEQEADGKPLGIIIGRLKGETTTTTQAFRYPRADWTEAQGRTHCTEHEGKMFEPATGEDAMATEHSLDRAIREEECASLEAYRAGHADPPTLYRPDGYLLKAAEQNQSEMTFVASEETPDRSGDVIEANGWDLDGYKINPVVMFAHNYAVPPIGTASNVWVKNKQLLSTIRFDAEDPFASFLQGKYKRGVMRAVSVGFRPLEFDTAPDGDGKKGMFANYVFKKVELLEISMVPVPMHPRALAKAMRGSGRFTLVMPEMGEKAQGGASAVEQLLGETNALLRQMVIEREGSDAGPQSVDWSKVREAARSWRGDNAN